MSRLRCQISMSLDGFVAGPNQRVDNALGDRGEELHEWIFTLKSWREPHGREGGEEGPSNAVVARAIENVGATIMGRNMFGGGPGPWPAEPWNGWWGDEPPFHHPVFVLTHHPREPLVLADTTFTFVTDGIESALEQARAAAGGRDVTIGGGAQAIRQYLRAGLLDELLINLVPVLLGSGAPLFDDPRDADVRLELTETVAAPGVTHLFHRVVR
jgi:dihydrofolate reductase